MELFGSKKFTTKHNFDSVVQYTSPKLLTYLWSKIPKKAGESILFFHELKQNCFINFISILIFKSRPKPTPDLYSPTLTYPLKIDLLSWRIPDLRLQPKLPEIALCAYLQ